MKFEKAIFSQIKAVILLFNLRSFFGTRNAGDGKGMSLGTKLSDIIVRAVRIILFLFLGFSSFPGISKEPAAINLQDISQRKIRNYLVDNEINQMHDFSSIHPSWKKEFDGSDFNFLEKEFFLNYDLRTVWECYRHVNSIKMWNGKSVSFGVLLTKSSNSVVYANDTSSPEIDTGQVYFLNLKLMKGLINVPVAFEITNIDQSLKMLEFSYIDSNKSQGKQTIRFFDNGDGRTRIVHTSYFKSGSHLRDNLFYPWFHKKFIKEFHGNMQHILESKLLSAHQGKM
jgi:hypothetical protein